jgi:hypothetical protein
VGFPALKRRSSGRVPEEHADGVRLEGHGCIDLQSPIPFLKSWLT